MVLDNLSTGFSWAVAPGVPLVVGESGDQALVTRLIRDHGVDAILHFAASIVVPESVADPLGYYRNNTVNSRALFECAVQNGVRHFIFSSTAAVYGNPAEIPVTERAPTAANLALWLLEADERDHAARRRPRPRSQIRHPALFQCRRRRPAGPHRTIHQGRHPSDQGRGRDRARLAPQARRVRHRLPDAGRHLRPRLYPRRRPHPRPFRRACLSARGRRRDDAQLRLRPRLLGAAR